MARKPVAKKAIVGITSDRSKRLMRYSFMLLNAVSIVRTTCVGNQQICQSGVK